MCTKCVLPQNFFLDTYLAYNALPSSTSPSSKGYTSKETPLWQCLETHSSHNNSSPHPVQKCPLSPDLNSIIFALYIFSAKGIHKSESKLVERLDGTPNVIQTGGELDLTFDSSPWYSREPVEVTETESTPQGGFSRSIRPTAVWVLKLKGALETPLPSNVMTIFRLRVHKQHIKSIPHGGDLSKRGNSREMGWPWHSH